MLRAEGLSVRYGRNLALDQVSLHAAAGEIVAVLGANGAGKSSLLKAMAGVQPCAAGSIFLEGTDITHARASARVRSGLSLVPEGRRILITMTVEDNLLLGGFARRGDLSAELGAVYARFPSLEKRRRMSASVLSGGEQQMLAIGRALMARPRIILLDEPSLGLSPLLQTEVFHAIARLNAEGATIVLVEQNVHKALACAHRVYVLELGRLVASGTPEEIKRDKVLQEAYLGRAKVA
jgi:branched-chain amino acid transport system ATP-binding protein